MGALVNGNSFCRSHHWERSWVLLSLVVVDGFRQDRSLVFVDFVRSGRPWLSSEAVFCALFGRKPEMVIVLV